MWKYRTTNFVENEHRKCISIGINGNFQGDHIKTLYMEPDWSFQDFLKASSQRLNLVPLATRAFTVDGVEIDDCLMIEDNDILFLSNNGEAFIMPSNLNLQQNDSSNAENSNNDDITIVHGYKVTSVLGKGGFGEVRLGEHTVTNEKVALKFLRKADISTIGAAERTVTEIQCLATLKHPNIIKLLHHTESAQHVVLIFELMEGGDLMKYLCKRGEIPTEVSLSEEECRPLFHQIISGVSYAHNHHICHRDLKLENILLKGQNLSLVKIADFGLSDFYRPGSTMRSNCGTLSFLSPEVFRGTANAGPPLDVWSLSVILFAILCGRLPFEDVCLSSRKRPRDAIVKSRILKGQYKLDENLSTEIKDLLRRMMKIDPEERASIPEILSHCWMRQHQPVYTENTMKVNAPLSFSKPRGVSQNSLVKSDSSSKSNIMSLSSMGHAGKSSFNTTTITDSNSSLRPLSPTTIQNIDEDSLNTLIYTAEPRSLSGKGRRSRTVSIDITDDNSESMATVPTRNLPMIHHASSSSTLTSRKSSRELDNHSDHSSLTTSARNSFTPSLPSLPQEPPTPVLVSTQSIGATNPGFGSNSGLVGLTTRQSSGSVHILLSAGLDIISPSALNGDKHAGLDDTIQLGQRHDLHTNTSPMNCDNKSANISPTNTTSSLISSFSDHFPLLQSANASEKNNNEKIIESNHTTATTTNNVTALKLIPLRRDRSASRTIDEFTIQYINSKNEEEIKSTTSNNESNGVNNSPMKTQKEETINIDEDDTNAKLAQISSKHGLSNRDVTNISRQTSSHVKSFQRSTVSSSQQSQLPSTSRLFERERNRQANATSSSSISIMNHQSSNESLSISPSLSPRSVSPLKTTSHRKEIGQDIAVDDDHDDEISVSKTSKNNRFPRNTRRNSGFSGSTASTMNYMASTKKDVALASSQSNGEKSNGYLVGIATHSISTRGK